MAGITTFLRGCYETDHLRRFVTEYFITVWNASRCNNRITGANLLDTSVDSPSHPAGSDEDDVCFFVCVVAAAFIRIVVIAHVLDGLE
jgi:hypothetical protein